MFVCVCVSVCLSVCLSVYVCVFVSLSLSLSVCLRVRERACVLRACVMYVLTSTFDLVHWQLEGEVCFASVCVLYMFTSNGVGYSLPSGRRGFSNQ